MKQIGADVTLAQGCRDVHINTEYLLDFSRAKDCTVQTKEADRRDDKARCVHDLPDGNDREAFAEEIVSEYATHVRDDREPDVWEHTEEACSGVTEGARDDDESRGGGIWRCKLQYMGSRRHLPSAL
jgi:hypothetical protein